VTYTDTGTYAPRLIVTGGPLDGKQLVCGPAVEKILGTSPNCQLQLEGANVDAVHARVIWEMRGLLLSDLGSGNGTYVNGERVSGDQPLNDGDRVSLGPPGARQSVKLLVYLPPDVAAASGAPATPPPRPAEDVFVLQDDAEPLVLEAESEAPSPAPPPAPPPVAPPSAAPPATPPAPVTARRDALETLQFPATLALPLADVPVQGAVTVSAPAIGIAAEEPPPALLEIEPEPAAPTPMPAPSPPAPSTPRPVTPPPPPRKPAKPDYSSELPSIDVPDRPRETLDLPPPPVATPDKPALAQKAAPVPGVRGGARRPGARPPRLALLGAATLALALGAWGAYHFLHQPPPVVLSVTPLKVEPGGTVTLAGSGFSSNPTGNVVRFGARPARVISASDTRLSVAVPELDVSRGPQNVAVSVETRGVRAGGLFLKVVALPKVTALEPDVALPGGEVAAVGRNLGARPVKVSVGDAAAEVLEAGPGRVRFRVPEMPVTIGRALPVRVSVAGESTTAPELVLGRLPLLLSVEPASGPAGTRAVLRGRGFSPAAADNQVTFLGRRALVLKAAPGELTVVAPGLRRPDLHLSAPVVVSVGGGSSAPVEFTLTSPAAASFVPRFFAVDASDLPGQVFVSSELGPLLALGDKGDASSVAERAASVADALNALVDAWSSGGAAALQVRDSPQPSVWTPGAAQPLVSVHAGDVAAYDRRARGASGGARKLAAFWGALIEDYLSLFVQGQRPSRVAELSSRGKVLLDLYAEAARRGRGTAGVPRNLVMPPGGALEAGLRDLALLPEGSGRAPAARAAAPIEGVWEGTVEEQDAGARRVQVTLRLQNGRLQGDVTTRSRGLGMSIPLSDLSYERGTLKFTLLSGGIPRIFVGTLQGAKVSGTIQVPGRKEPIGRFSFDLVQ
jgi:hypothetical protein